VRKLDLAALGGCKSLLFLVLLDRSMQEVGSMGTCFILVERDAAFETLAQTRIRFDASISTCKTKRPSGDASIELRLLHNVFSFKMLQLILGLRWTCALSRTLSRACAGVMESVRSILAVAWVKPSSLVDIDHEEILGEASAIRR
jgi:hypothetical protein